MRYKILALLLFCSVALAGNGDRADVTGVVDSGYMVDVQTAGFRTGLSSADTLTTAAVLGLTSFPVKSRTTISVGARFSAASQTCRVQIAYVYQKPAATLAADNTTTSTNVIKGWSSVVTLTGSAAQKEGAYYEAPDFPFDSGRAVTIRVILIAAPASGTVDLWVGS